MSADSLDRPSNLVGGHPEIRKHLAADAMALAEQPEEQQAKRDGAADGWDVIQDEMKMWSVHGSP